MCWEGREQTQVVFPFAGQSSDCGKHLDISSARDQSYDSLRVHPQHIADIDELHFLQEVNDVRMGTRNVSFSGHL